MKTSLFIGLSMTIVVASPVLALISQDKPDVGDVALVIASPFGEPIAQILKHAHMKDAHPNRAPIGAFVILDTSQSYDSLIQHGALFVLRGEEILKLC